MVYHDWGDEGVDWEGIDKAASLIVYTCRVYGRLGGDAKEKYGTVRFYVSFGYLSLHTLLYPGYHYIQFPKWLHTLDLYIISPVLQFFFERLFVKWQQKVYVYAYRLAVKRYPHLREEILECADWPELLT